MNILDQLADFARKRTAEAKKKMPLEEIKRHAASMTKGSFAFENALKKPDISFICECKKASPSKGLIAPDFPYLQIAKEYEMAGADCISVLTEPKWFLGSDGYLSEISESVSIPCLRKDFLVDEYMIYEARLLGASAVLLICAILSEAQIEEYIHICDNLGISALVEAHDEKEVYTALKAGARIIGVNNRNLKDFSVDTDNSRRLRELIPPEILFVSESGVKNAEDVAKLRKIGADAVLIGETLMRADDKKAKLAELRGGISEADERDEAGETSERGEVSEAGENGKRGEVSEAGENGKRGEVSEAGKTSERGEVSEAGETSERGEVSEAGENSERGAK